MLKEIVIAIQSYFRAHRFIREHKLWKWIVLPGLFYCLLFVASMALFIGSASHIIEWVLKASRLTAWMSRSQSGFMHFVFVFAGFIIWIILLLFYFSLFKYIWLIVGSPVFAYLSEKTEAIIKGRDFPLAWGQLLKDMARGIAIALRNTLWQTVYAVSVLILSFIPVVGWATPVLAILIDCYYYGFSMLDYSCERRQMTASKSIYFIGRHRGLAIGNGIVFYMMHLIPLFGWVVAPAYAVIAATLSMLKMEEKK